MSAVEIIEQIRNLPDRERREVLEQIQDEFGDFDLTPEQIAELDRRAEEFQKNPENGIPWEQVRDNVRKRSGWK